MLRDCRTLSGNPFSGDWVLGMPTCPIIPVLKQITRLVREEATCHSKQAGVRSTNFLRRVPLCLEMMPACFYVPMREQTETYLKERRIK